MYLISKFYKVFFFKNFNKFFLINLINYIYIYIGIKTNYYIYYYFYNIINSPYYTLFFINLFKLWFIQEKMFKFFLFSCFFLEFFVDGLYYRVKYYLKYNILGFILGYNHYILFKLPKKIKACVHMKKRRFFIYGFNLFLLGIISMQLVNLKYPNLFKGKGLRIKFLSFRKKTLIKKK